MEVKNWIYFVKISYNVAFVKKMKNLNIIIELCVILIVLLIFVSLNIIKLLI